MTFRLIEALKVWQWVLEKKKDLSSHETNALHKIPGGPKKPYGHFNRNQSPPVPIKFFLPCCNEHYYQFFSIFYRKL